MCPHVAELVSFGGQLVPVAEHEIGGLTALVASDLQYDPVPLIKEGTLVKVMSGPLRGVTGRLVRHGEHDRLILAVDVIGQGVSVDLAAADVHPC